ncbi:hypothetical protein MTP99_003694 [Tenebrio molitor]|nr:hypothetical protein MTP99_003694 [Tenebrio molitor]
MKILMFFSALSAAQLSYSLSLPPTFQKCDKKKSDFNECLSQAIQNAIVHLDKPLEEYGLPSFEPFMLSSVSPRLGRKIDFEHTFKNYKIFGRTKISNTKANMNFYDKTLTIVITNPEIQYVFDYEAKGKMFLLPIDTSGPATILSHNVTYTITFTFEEYTKDGKTHLHVIDDNLVMQPQELIFNFENLLEDKELNDGFNRAMNRKWKPIFNDLAPIYVANYGHAYAAIFNNFLSKVPLMELFDGV